MIFFIFYQNPQYKPHVLDIKSNLMDQTFKNYRHGGLGQKVGNYAEVGQKDDFLNTFLLATVVPTGK